MKKTLFALLIGGFCALSAADAYDSVLSGLEVLPAERYARVPMAGGDTTIIFEGVGYPLRVHSILEPQIDGRALSTTIEYIRELTDQLFISKDSVLLEEQAVDKDDGKKLTLPEILAREAAGIVKKAEQQAKILAGFGAKAADQATNGELERAVQKAGTQTQKEVAKFFKKFR